MLVRPLLAIAAGAALASTAACEASAAGKVHTVVIDKMAFGPAPAAVRAGDTIVWVNKDVVSHTATARDGSFNVDLPPRSKGSTVVRKAGTLPFYCIYHPAMRGTLTVRR